MIWSGLASSGLGAVKHIFAMDDKAAVVMVLSSLDQFHLVHFNAVWSGLSHASQTTVKYDLQMNSEDFSLASMLHFDGHPVKVG